MAGDTHIFDNAACCSECSCVRHFRLLQNANEQQNDGSPSNSRMRLPNHTYNDQGSSILQQTAQQTILIHDAHRPGNAWFQGSDDSLLSGQDCLIYDLRTCTTS